MDTRSEIRNNIESTREHITQTVDLISNTIHQKVDWHEKVKQNPAQSLLIAVGVGFTLATFSTPLGRFLIKIGMKSVTAAASAYITKQGLNYLSGKITSI